MALTGIFKGKLTENLFWMDCLVKDDIAQAKYFVDDSNAAGCHKNIKSAIYDDLAGYVDQLQDEEDLSYDELYVVTYFEFEECSFGLMQKVDFGITKWEIIENVKAQKYMEGANYYTMGQMFYATRAMMEKRQGGAQ